MARRCLQRRAQRRQVHACLIAQLEGSPAPVSGPPQPPLWPPSGPPVAPLNTPSAPPQPTVSAPAAPLVRRVRKLFCNSKAPPALRRSLPDQREEARGVLARRGDSAERPLPPFSSLHLLPVQGTSESRRKGGWGASGGTKAGAGETCACLLPFSFLFFPPSGRVEGPPPLGCGEGALQLGPSADPRRRHFGPLPHCPWYASGRFQAGPRHLPMSDVSILFLRSWACHWLGFGWALSSPSANHC